MDEEGQLVLEKVLRAAKDAAQVLRQGGGQDHAFAGEECLVEASQRYEGAGAMKCNSLLLPARRVHLGTVTTVQSTVKEKFLLFLKWTSSVKSVRYSLIFLDISLGIVIIFLNVMLRSGTEFSELA